MLKQRGLKRFTVILLSVIILIMNLPLQALAEYYPWDAYSQYIPNDTPISKRQLRGAWICTVVNLDWPSKETKIIENDDERIQKSKEELITLLDKAARMNLNAVFFQVSPEGDAFYQSSIVPWSRYLTGTFGKDPGFDPLAFAIEEAHKRNLEIHAWLNPYRVSMDTGTATIESLHTEKSVYMEHPELIKTSMNRFVVDPGIPESRKWVKDRVMEVVNNYDIDGIHFDDYFYYESYAGELGDEDTFSNYNPSGFSNIGDWRRNNTYILVKELSDTIRATKPWVKFGISPSGVWGNQSDHPGGSNTNTSYTNYDKCFVDTKKWVEEELLDYIAPQIYFSFANSRAPYGEVASWWAEVCRGKKVHLYIGQALYKINDDSDPYFKGENAVSEFSRQLKFNAVKPEIMGTILFRTKNLYDSGKQQVVNVMKDDLWATKALVPVMSWKGGKAPGVPLQGKLEEQSGGTRLSWNDHDINTAYYAIYRFHKGENIDFASNSGALKLVGTVRKNNNGSQEFVDTATGNPDDRIYVVTALDRLHNESGGLVISNSLSANFNDISKSYSWAVKAIDDLYQKGVIYGSDYGTFDPGDPTKRGDFMLMVVRALNLKADYKDNFADVAKGSYYYDAMGVAKALGIAQGSGTYFNPDGNITREDMMVILVKALGVTGVKLEDAGEEYLKEYRDAKSVSSYAREAIVKLTKAGLIEGSGGEVDPKRLATRAEIAVMLHRILNSTNNKIRS